MPAEPWPIIQNSLISQLPRLTPFRLTWLPSTLAHLVPAACSSATGGLGTAGAGTACTVGGVSTLFAAPEPPQAASRQRGSASSLAKVVVMTCLLLYMESFPFLGKKKRATTRAWRYPAPRLASEARWVTDIANSRCTGRCEP